MPLVGLVVVSHSQALAQAAVSLASEMVHDRPVRIAVAAGLDDVTFGTDAVRIKEAIEEVDNAAGVVVLMDLGSAVLSAELAVDLLEDPAVRARVCLSAAPLVEGLIVAAVAAAGGASRSEVAADAQGALMGKATHLGSAGIPPQPDVTPGDVTRGEVTRGDVARATFTVANTHGLHARPAARLVGELRGLDARVQLRNLTTGGDLVPAWSLSRVATLGALPGHEVEILASGHQASEAVNHLLALAARNFDEPAIDAHAAAAQHRSGPLGASPGVAIGPARFLLTRPVTDRSVGDAPSEWRRFVAAIADVERDIERVRAITARDVGTHEAQIFDAHLMLLGDTEMLDDIKRHITGGVHAIAATRSVLSAVAAQWSELTDPYLRARAEDVRAVENQLVAALTHSPTAEVSAPGVLIARELSPAQVAEFDRATVQGIVLAYGSPSSHAAILARARGIPAIAAAGPDVLNLADGTTVIIDGSSGELIVDPSEATLATLRQQSLRLAERRRVQRATADQPAATLDGTTIEVAANLGSAADAELAAAEGADGAGLVRTEFLFLNRRDAPGIEEQTAEYRAIAQSLAGRRVTLRTLDVGGDKPLPYLPMPAEDNPFLGHRGLRLSLDRPALLLDQLRAIVEVARDAPTNVMFPMVTTLSELQAARALLAVAAGPCGLPDSLRIGMMVEVPAAALKVATFLPWLDFISIGTNDLTQYTLAAERGNAAVAGLHDALDPGVLALIRHVCRVAAAHVAVGVCGEAAADETAIPIFLGLGVRELSVTPLAVPTVKACVRTLDLAQCMATARAALELPDAAAVRNLIAMSRADDQATPTANAGVADAESLADALRSNRTG